MVKLKTKEEEREFPLEQAQNILTSPINGKVKDPWKLSSDSSWKLEKGKLVKKKKK